MSHTIPLTKGYVAIVDDDDFDELSRFNWHVVGRSSRLYAARHQRRTEVKAGEELQYILMHRHVLGLNQGQKAVVDHRNHDTLDNRKANLRVCDQSGNIGNSRNKVGSSIYKGVSWYKAYGKWMARVTVNYRSRFLGYFEDEAEAARAYDKAAIEEFGEFAYLNFRDDS